MPASLSKALDSIMRLARERIRLVDRLDVSSDHVTDP
jgi:hypothetical protein